MATFNFGNNNNITNSQLADNINNAALGDIHAGKIDKESVIAVLELWKTKGLPQDRYEELYSATKAAPTIGNNSQTRMLLGKLMNLAKTGGAVMETYTGLSLMVTGLSNIFA